jgi:hypothetical protein
MKKHFTVNPNNYALFDYTPYFDRNCNPIARPKKPKFDLGDVVYIKNENSIGVVLGCIDHESEELRTDMDGMQCFDNLEFATAKHFELKDVHFVDALKEEIFLENKKENSQVIGLVTHIKVRDFDYHTAKQIKKTHPLGTVYEIGRDGYVASGYDWYKFPVAKLEFINDNH